MPKFSIQLSFPCPHCFCNIQIDAHKVIPPEINNWEAKNKLFQAKCENCGKEFSASMIEVWFEDTSKNNGKVPVKIN